MSTNSDRSCWGDELRRWRSQKMAWSQQDLVDNIVQLAYRRNESRGTKLEVRLVSKWENGSVRSPQGIYRRLLAELGAPLPTLAPRSTPSLEAVSHHERPIGCPSIPEDGVEAVLRRDLLKAGSGLALSGLAGKLDHSWSSQFVDKPPIEHFQQLRQVLIDSDNLFGSAPVIPVVHEQIKIIHSLRSRIRGRDALDLIRMQTQFAEFAGWLHQDQASHSASCYWMDRALEWSNLSYDPELPAFGG